MAVIMEWLNWAVLSGPNLLAAIMAALGALIAFFLLIPGEQPEKALQSAVDFLAKLSLKK